jgi:hypothetical protein
MDFVGGLWSQFCWYLIWTSIHGRIPSDLKINIQYYLEILSEIMNINISRSVFDSSLKSSQFHIVSLVSKAMPRNHIFQDSLKRRDYSGYPSETLTIHQLFRQSPDLLKSLNSYPLALELLWLTLHIIVFSTFPISWISIIRVISDFMLVFIESMTIRVPNQ